MKGKKYPTIEEEDGYGSMNAADPMADVYAYKNLMPDHLDCEEFEVEDIPSFGPTTPKQAVSRLQKAERQFASGQWMTGDVFFARTRKIIDQYAS